MTDRWQDTFLVEPTLAAFTRANLLPGELSVFDDVNLVANYPDGTTFQIQAKKIKGKHRYADEGIGHWGRISRFPTIVAQFSIQLAKARDPEGYAKLEAAASTVVDATADAADTDPEVTA
jgi:hypothetical protein